MLNKILISILLSLLSAPLLAEAPLTYDRVRLNAEARVEVTTDTLVAVLSVQREGQDAARLADEVNGEMRWALQRAKAVAAVEAQTLDYRTQPIYHSNRLTGWRVHQSLRLESRDAAALGDLLGALQERLALQSLGYEVSNERLDEVRDGLIRDALAAFTARAKMIAEALGSAGYRLVELQVNDAGGGRPPPRPYMAMAMDSARAAAPPAIEPGNQEVTVSVSGVVELERR